MNTPYNLTQAGKMPPFTAESSIDDLKHYKPSDELISAVNIAIWLGQPLLLTGEPGTGKTQLAYHIAHMLETDIFEFNTQTTSTATDLFYRYDAIRHFQYAQNSKEVVLDDKAVEDRFIEYQALGKAIKSGKRCVVLIDEIDKAPRDLPNDILFAMDKLGFEVPEINRTGENKILVEKENRPVVILTSNSEKNLPDAFLRRCVFFHIEFPKTGQLLEILTARISGYTEPELLDLIEHFEQIREKVRRKKPATAELLQWVMTLRKLGFQVEGLHESALPVAQKTILQASYTVLIKDQEDLKLLKN